jgi:transglutaminase-like putative cysteine protease
VKDDTTKRRWPFTWAKKEKAPPKAQPVFPMPRWGNWQQWVNTALLFVTLEIAVLSVELAHWVTPQPLLSLVLVLSVAVTFTLVKIRIWGVFKHIIAVVVGLLITFWQTMNCLAASETTSKFAHLINIFQSWWSGTETLLPGDDTIVFVVFITLVAWLIGYISTWFVLRRNNPWVAVILGVMVIMFNLTNLPDSYYIYFILYFFAAALFIAVTRMTARSADAENTANYSGSSLLYLGVSLLVITAIAASISWVAPQARATGLQNWIATSLPWQSNFLESKANIFGSVPAKTGLSTSSTLEDLRFRQSWHQSDEIEFVVVSQRPSYWRMNAYDTYESWGWTNGLMNQVSLEADMPWADAVIPSSQETMEYAVVTGIRTDVLFTNGGFISSDIPVRLNYDMQKDILSVVSVRMLESGEKYVVTSYFSTANESDLSKAGSDYPFAIKYTYLQLPADFPEDIRLLSENITQGATTPYAKVKAILNYLDQFSYSVDVDAPPEGVDNVEYFLFTQKKGYCLHFASAAAVMLRSVGVPTRLAVGYLPGDPSKTPFEYILRDKYYHAWPQVYFPGYGWVDIEATPAGPASLVSINTPWVSSPAIAASPQWEIWQGAQPPSIYDLGSIDIERMQGSGSAGTDTVSFAGKVGQAFLFIFIAAVTIALLIGLVLLIRAASFRWLWRVDRNAIAYGTYVNMCRLAAMVGLNPKPQQTPLEFTAELVAALPQNAESLHYITRVYMENRFGGRESKLDFAEEAEVLKARHIVYNALIQRLGKVRRLLAFGRR